MHLHLELPKLVLSWLTVEVAQMANYFAGVGVAGAWIIYLLVKTRSELRRTKAAKSEDET